LAHGLLAAKIADLPIGFSWISLDSFVRIVIYQWVMRDKSKNIFLERFGHGALEARGTGGSGRGHAEAGTCS
jgi:hypothetical protein